MGDHDPRWHNAGSMIPRYSLPEMSAIWSDEHRLSTWKDVEALTVEAWAELGVAPASAAEAANDAAVTTPADRRLNWPTAC